MDLTWYCYMYGNKKLMKGEKDLCRSDHVLWPYSMDEMTFCYSTNFKRLLGNMKKWGVGSCTHIASISNEARVWVSKNHQYGGNQHIRVHPQKCIKRNFYKNICNMQGSHFISGINATWKIISCFSHFCRFVITNLRKTFAYDRIWLQKIVWIKVYKTKRCLGATLIYYY